MHSTPILAVCVTESGGALNGIKAKLGLKRLLLIGFARYE